MPEVVAAIIGAGASVLVMGISNMSTRRDRDTRELFKRINELEKLVAGYHPPQRNWRKQ